MRILVLSSFYPPHHLGGYEIACESTVTGLRERGHDVRVMTTRYRRSGLDDDGGAVRALHLFWDDGEWRRPGFLGAVRSTRQDLRIFGRALAGFRPDAVWAWQMSAVSKSLLARCFSRGIPVVLALHDLWPLYDLEPDPWLRWTLGARSAVGRPVGALLGFPTDRFDLGHAAGASFNSAWTREQLVRSDLVPGGPVIHPGVGSEFVPTPLRGAVRRFLVVGRVEPRKGAGVAVEALARVRAAGIGDATLTVYGPSEQGYRAQLEAQARRLDVADAVAFGRGSSRAELAHVYEGHDALVHAATWDEPFGLAILEAMVSGRPVIASPTGGAREIVSADNALTFPPGDAEACAKRMWQLASDPSIATRLVEAGRKTAVRFSQDEAVRAHEEQLRSVTDR